MSKKKAVVIGVDPHKLSVTIEVVDGEGGLLGTGRFGTDKAGFAALRRYVSQIAGEVEGRLWAVEGANGAGRSLAHRLLAAGERVVDVPAKLAARVRLFDTGHNRKTDAVDAHSIAMVAVRTEIGTAGLRVLTVDDEVEAIRMLSDRYDELSKRRIQTVNRLHRLIAELVPGTRKKDLSALQAKAILAAVRPRDLAGRTRRRMAGEELADLVRTDAQIKTIKADLKTAITERGSTLMELAGIGPVGAARVLADVGDVTRFPDRSHLASWNGTAPIDASSGDVVRHRLSRAGNRQINRTLHTMAIVQLRHPGPGRDYYDRKRADGKSSMEAMRALKRRLSDIVFRLMLDDAIASLRVVTREVTGTGPGGQTGNDSDSSAAGSHPSTDSSDKSLPGPADADPRTPLPTAS